YEIVCTVRPNRLAAFQSAARALGVAVTDIGRIVRRSGATFPPPGGKPPALSPPPFRPFLSLPPRYYVPSKSQGKGMHDIASRVAAISGHKRSPNFLKNQRWYPTVYDLRRGAQQRLPRFAFEYGDGGAGDDTGIKQNWSALDSIQMVPRY